MNEEQKPDNQEISDDEAIMRIASALKDGVPPQDDKQNVHTFLINVVQTEDIDKIIKVGNLRDDKDLNELGNPRWNARGALEMARISEMIMVNPFFQEYFVKQTGETLSTSLSREGFLIRQATTSTRQVADITKRKKINKGWFGKEKIEETGGDTIVSK